MTFIFQVWVQARAKKQRNTLLIWRSIASHSDTAAQRTTLPSLWWVWWVCLEGIVSWNMSHVWVISGKGHCVFWFVSSSSTYLAPGGGGGTGFVVKHSPFISCATFTCSSKAFPSQMRLVISHFSFSSPVNKTLLWPGGVISPFEAESHGLQTHRNRPEMSDVVFLTCFRPAMQLDTRSGPYYRVSSWTGGSLFFISGLQ